MNYSTVENPTLCKDGSILCTVLFEGFDEPVPFIARSTDLEQHGKELYERCLAKEFGELKEYVEPPPQVPLSVTRRQLKLALLQADLLDEVETMIAGSTDRALKINWEDAKDFERSNSFVAQLGTLLGKTQSDIDAMFILANTL